MTKTENRAAARAVAKDVEQLGQLRHYLIHRRKIHLPGCELIDAIDDDAEKLTGNQTALHAKSSSIG